MLLVSIWTIRPGGINGHRGLPDVRALACPRCSFHRYDRRDVDSSWRHLDLGARPCRLRMARRRLACSVHGVLTEGVPFARPGARFTSNFEDLVVWLATRSDKTSVATFAQVAWRTVGAMCQRVSANVLDPERLNALVTPGLVRSADASTTGITDDLRLPGAEVVSAQRRPAKRSSSGRAAPVMSWTRTNVSMPIIWANLSLPMRRKKMFSL